MSEQSADYVTRPEQPRQDQWQAEVIRLIERQLPDRGPFVIVVRGDGQGRLFLHGDGGAPAVVRIRAS